MQSWTVELGEGVKYVIDPLQRTVKTVYADGIESTAWRPVTHENMVEAADQGYGYGEAGVWASLVEHEAMHTLVSRAVWRRESRVIRQAGGGERVSFVDALYEEALVLALQHWLNNGQPHEVLSPHPDLQLVASLVRAMNLTENPNDRLPPDPS